MNTSTRGHMVILWDTHGDHKKLKIEQYLYQKGSIWINIIATIYAGMCNYVNPKYQRDEKHFVDFFPNKESCRQHLMFTNQARLKGFTPEGTEKD